MPAAAAPSDSTLSRVLDIVTRIAGPTRQPPGPGPETRLAGGGFWLDSIDLLELMLACDETFGPVFGGAGGSRLAKIETVGDLVAAIRERARP